MRQGVQGYSYTSQAISELTAIGAPTRPFLFMVVAIFQVLAIAFVVGLWFRPVRRGSPRLTVMVLIIGVIVQ